MPQLLTCIRSWAALRRIGICGTVSGMKKPIPPTAAHGVRLRKEVWPKLRAVMRIRGRAWLEGVIEREFKRQNPEPKQ